MSPTRATVDLAGPVGSTPPGWPVPGITFAGAVRRGFRQYAGFDGRASLSEFWYWYLFVVGVLLALVLPSIALGLATSADGSFGAAGAVGLAVAALFYLAVLVPTIAAACRRLHDAGYSGLFLLLAFVAGGIVPLIMCLLPTSPNAVRYGPPPSPGTPGRGQPYGTTPAFGPTIYPGSPPPYVRQPPSVQHPPYGQAPAYGQQPPRPPAPQHPSPYARPPQPDEPRHD